MRLLVVAACCVAASVAIPSRMRSKQVQHALSDLDERLESELEREEKEKELIDSLIKAAGQGLKDTGNLIQKTVTKTVDAVADAVDTVKGAVKDPGSVVEKVKETHENNMNALKEAIDDPKTAFVNALDAATDASDKFFDEAGKLIKAPLDILNGMTDIALADTVKDYCSYHGAMPAKEEHLRAKDGKFKIAFIADPHLGQVDANAAGLSDALSCGMIKHNLEKESPGLVVLGGDQVTGLDIDEGHGGHGISYYHDQLVSAVKPYPHTTILGNHDLEAPHNDRNSAKSASITRCAAG